MSLVHRKEQHDLTLLEQKEIQAMSLRRHELEGDRQRQRTATPTVVYGTQPTQAAGPSGDSFAQGLARSTLVQFLKLGQQAVTIVQYLAAAVMTTWFQTLAVLHSVALVLLQAMLFLV